MRKEREKSENRTWLTARSATAPLASCSKGWESVRENEPKLRESRAKTESKLSQKGAKWRTSNSTISVLPYWMHIASGD